MAGLPNTFDVIRSDPDWKGLPPEEQVEVREKWVQKRMLASGDPRNQNLGRGNERLEVYPPLLGATGLSEFGI